MKLNSERTVTIIFVDTQVDPIRFPPLCLIDTMVTCNYSSNEYFSANLKRSLGNKINLKHEN